MVFIASYTEEEVNRGGVMTMETTCVSEATTFWPIFYFIGVMCLLFFFPLLVLIAIYTVIARHLVADPVMQSSAGGSGGTAGRSQRIQVHQSNSSANAGGGSGSAGGGGENVNPNLRARRQVVVMVRSYSYFFYKNYYSIPQLNLTWISLDVRVPAHSWERLWCSSSFVCCRFVSSPSGSSSHPTRS